MTVLFGVDLRQAKENSLYAKGAYSLYALKEYNLHTKRVQYCTVEEYSLYTKGVQSVH